MILDDGADATLLILLGADAEKDPSLLANPGNDEERALFDTIKRRLAKQPGFYSKTKANIKGVTEETTTGVLRLYQRQKKGTLPFPAINVNLLKSLAEKNIQPEDVTDVILTHLHFDHVGGATHLDPDGQIRPQFPNANYYVQKKQLEWAQKGFPKDRASYLSENIEPLYKSGKLKILEGPQKLMEGVELILSEGHTIAQQMVRISGQNENLIYLADLIPMTAHLNLPWVMAYDLHPVQTIQEKEEILEKAIKEEWLLFFEHDPRIYCGQVYKSEKGYQLKNSTKL